MPGNRPNHRPPAGGLLIANPPAPGSLAPGLLLSRRPSPRRLLAVVALAVLLIAAAAPSVSAESIITDEIISEYTDTSGQSKITGSGTTILTVPISKIRLTDVSKARNINYIGFDLEGGVSAGYPEGRQDFTWYLGEDKSITGNGYFVITHSRNVLGNVIGTNVILYFYDFNNIGGLTDRQIIEINKPFCTIRRYDGNPGLNNDGNSYALLDVWGYQGLYSSTIAPIFPYYSTISSYDRWQSQVVFTDISPDMGINIYRVIDSRAYQSSVSVVTSLGEVFNSEDTKDIELIYPINTLNWVNITSPAGTLYPFKIGAPSGGEDSLVTVYVRNSQTGALLADGHIVISANVDDEFHEVINQTLPGGIYNGPLQPTGGGMPNPDYYRLIASADGYNPIMPYLDFEHGSSTTIIIEMEPTVGGPEDDNKTFIEFYVRDMAANGISDATVTCGPYTLITNSAGYTQFEMPVNSTYPYTVTKSGYVTIEGRATVADGPRYIVNVVLGPKEIPTNPPATDPGGPGATPTPDRRTNEEKGQSIIDMIADNAEPLVALALLGTFLGLFKLMAKW